MGFRPPLSSCVYENFDQERKRLKECYEIRKLGECKRYKNLINEKTFNREIEAVI